MSITVDIFTDVLLNPSFDSEEIERARREILADINRQGDNPHLYGRTLICIETTRF